MCYGYQVEVMPNFEVAIGNLSDMLKEHEKKDKWELLYLCVYYVSFAIIIVLI